MTRLFVAVWPSVEVLDALYALPDLDETGVRRVAPENWHITLRFVGDGTVDEVREMLTGTELPSATAQLGPRIERLGPRQIVVPATGVDHLAAAVRAATGGGGVPDRHRFRGHLTIARTTPTATSRLVGRPFDAEFEVSEIALVSSELRPTGAVYTTVERFPTAGAPDEPGVTG